MRILDLYCCEGGAGVGYHRAGFDVIGVDIDPQPLYPYPFHQGNALHVLRDLLLSDVLGTPVKLAGVEYVLGDFDAIHASPPCQAHSTITPDKSKHVDLIPETRELLAETGLPYVIENVDGARNALIDPMRLCGSSFGLRVRRHRWFESSIHLTSIPCAHSQQGNPVGVYGDHADTREHLRPDGTRRGAKARSTAEAREAMGMPWASWYGCTQAVPPRVYGVDRQATTRPHSGGGSMTTLSPAEQAEVTRFGIHDEAILRDMQEHMYDVPVCDGCDLRAAVRLVHSCCHHVDLACAVHHADIHDYVSSRLVGAWRGVSCVYCDALFRHPQTVADVYTEVPL